jgi:Zn-dependent M16 (insulinase) family peptidase
LRPATIDTVIDVCQKISPMRSAHIAALLLLAACHTPRAAHVTPAAATKPTQTAADVTLDTLTDGSKQHSFTVEAIYLDDADKPLGARFVHDKTGFTFDYLRIESAPQGFIWVNSFPTSDQGEPHTQEHLLLGKGDRGRRLGSSEAMALAESSAFTAQWRTAYHFHTVAGNDVFWPVFGNQLDALLNPDYTDEEIRREVRNFGVDKAADGSLRLEEKGTVYNEMVRTYEAPETNLWRAAGQLVYGATHPLALDSGGYPAAIRTMTPQDIRTFHDAAYHLANMGMVGAFPSSMALSDVLDHTSAILDKEAGRTGKVMTEADLPAPAAGPAGTIQIVDYPYAETTNPGPMMLVWPASRKLDETEHTLLQLFVDAFAGDESTPLYKKLIDSKSRVMDLGASAVWSMVSTDQGEPVYIGLTGVKADKLDDRTVGEVRQLVLAELDRLAKLPDGDPELVAFDQKIQTRVVDMRRRLAKFLDTPPGFGFRGTGSGWIDFLHQLSRDKGFRKSLTLRPELAAIDTLLAGKANPWRTRIHTWGLDQKPFGIAARPSPDLRKKLDKERDQRIADELDRLQKEYGTKDKAATLARYAQDYDAETQKLEATAKSVELPPLVATPPMTLDDGLQYTQPSIAGVPSLVATFDSMASARVQMIFGVGSVVPGDQQVWLAALPSLLSDAGVIVDGKPIAADEMKDRLRKEILELSVYYTASERTGRVELVVAGAGNGAAETKTALAWMRRVMTAPDWRVDNLPRLRDLIDQQLTSVRQRMLGAEESWVDDPRDAWWQQQRQRLPLEYLHTSSFLTQAHDLHRLRWMLMDPGDPKVTAEVAGFLTKLADAKTLKRAQLAALAGVLAKGSGSHDKALATWTGARLSAKAAPLAREAGKDLAALLGDLPDDSLAADWSYLCREMAKDLQVGAPAALAQLAQIRERLFTKWRARIVEVGSTANQQAIAGDVASLAGGLSDRTNAVSEAPHPGLLTERLLERTKANAATFVGLYAPSTSSGVFENLAPAPYYADTSDDAVLDYLASNLYTGHGGHSIFMKTWAAGLAYSNGLHPHVSIGTIDYYAERCPLLPQTIRFVIDQLHKAKPDANIARYAIATAFGSRIANGYESRASAMAADLVDGLTPSIVRSFRQHVLDEAKRGDLAATLFDRMPKVYAKVLPGMGALDPKGIYFVIGPDKQLAAYQDYLHATVGKGATLLRLYPRDFWLTAPL